MKNKSTNTILNLIAIILIATIIVSSAIGLYAWAKYKSKINGVADAQVAKWHFDLSNTEGTSLSETGTIDLAETIDFEHVASNRIAPGTYGLFQMVVDTRGTEVNLLYEIEVALTDCPTNLNFYTDSEHKNLISKEGNKLTFAEYLTHTQAINYNETINIYWNWPYETLDGNNSSTAGDAQDNLDQGKTVTMKITATGTQMLSKPVILGTVKNGETEIISGRTERLRVGDKTTLSVTGEVEEVTYSSSDTEVVTVDSSTGEVVAVAKGNAIITITGKDSGRTITINVKVSSPISLNVGDTIKYTPSGTYNWDKALATSDQTGIDILQSGTGQDYNISEWYVYGIEGDNVKLVPKVPTSTVRLHGAQGYNNAVKLLNDACSALYGNKEKGITARSINIEDFENVMDKEKLKDVQKSAGYNTQKYDAYTTKAKQYPEIYASEKNSVITKDGTTVENNNGLGLSEQTGFIYRTAENKNTGTITTAESIRPYQTYYNMSSSDLEIALGTTYKKVLLNNGKPSYWVASRCVDLYLGSCNFFVHGVGNSNLGNCNMLSSLGSPYECE